MLRKLARNYTNSCNGLAECVGEHSFRLELVAAAMLTPFVLWADRPTEYKALAFVMLALLLGFEALNTAIEKLCDRITLEHDERIGAVKDIGSAAVFLLLLANAIFFAVYFLG